MTDQVVEMLVQQRRIETTLEITFAALMVTALVAGVFIMLTILRRRHVPIKVTVFAVCAAVLGIVSDAARIRVGQDIHQAVEKAIQDQVRTSRRQVPSDVVSLYR